MDALKWKKGDRVVVLNDPDRPIGTIHAESVLASPGDAHVRFWPVMFDDLSEKVIEESALAAADEPAREGGSVRPRFAAGDTIKTAGAVAGTVVSVTVEDGKPRYELRVVIAEEDLELGV